MSSKSGRPRSSQRTARAETEIDSWASSPAVRHRMQKQRTRDTAPELLLRRLLHASGLRYRVDAAPLPGLRRRADIVFRPAKLAVFIDGCYWHGCPEHGARVPKSNSEYWRAKVLRNQARDADTDRRLVAAGWLSVRAWEHDDPTDVAEQVRRLVASRRRSLTPCSPERQPRVDGMDDVDFR